MVNERGNFVAAFAKWGNREADHVQAVVQILAEPALLDQLLEISVGCRDDADVDGQRAFAERADFTGLEKPQQLRLQIHTQFPNLVEEQRPAFGGSDESRIVAIGAGKRTTTIAE